MRQIEPESIQERVYYLKLSEEMGWIKDRNNPYHENNSNGEFGDYYLVKIPEGWVITEDNDDTFHYGKPIKFCKDEQALELFVEELNGKSKI